MKIGDRVKLKYSFDIDDYSIEYGIFNISINITKQKKENWVVPLFIGSLGIYPEGNRYVIPGDYLPYQHPQYYESIDANKMIVKLNDHAYRVILDHEFQYNGKYRLVPIDDKSLMGLSVIAIQHTDVWLQSVCEDLRRATMDGEVLHGTVVRMFNSKNGTHKYYPEVVTPITKRREKIIVVIHDEDTNVEYPLPLEHLVVR